VKRPAGLTGIQAAEEQEVDLTNKDIYLMIFQNLFIVYWYFFKHYYYLSSYLSGLFF